MKKAQGLSFNVIVIAAIALVILIVIIAWSLGVFGYLFGQAKTAAEITDADIVAEQSKCTKLCMQAQGANSPEDWPNTGYCKTIAMKITENEEIKDVYCWEDPVFQFCEVNIDGKTCDQNNCLEGC